MSVFVNLNEIDFDSLDRGVTLTPQQLERAAECDPADEEWGLALLQIVAAIECYFQRERGMTVAVRRSGHCLRILTNEEQAEHAGRLGKSGVKKFRKGRRIAMGVDDSNFNNAQRDRLAREIQMQTLFLEDVAKRRRQVLPRPVERATPTMEGGQRRNSRTILGGGGTTPPPETGQAGEGQPQPPETTEGQ